MPDNARASESRSASKCILVLPTTHHTLLAEEALRSTNVRYLTVPKPEKTVSDCGMAIRIECGDLSRASEALERMEVKFFLQTAYDEIEPIEPEDIP